MTLRAETTDGLSEEHPLTMRQWYREELLPMLHDAGFASVDVLPGVHENRLVYLADRSRVSTSTRLRERPSPEP